MKHVIYKYVLILGLIAAGLIWSGEFRPSSNRNAYPLLIHDVPLASTGCVTAKDLPASS